MKSTRKSICPSSMWPHLLLYLCMILNKERLKLPLKQWLKHKENTKSQRSFMKMKIIHKTTDFFFFKLPNIRICTDFKKGGGGDNYVLINSLHNHSHNLVRVCYLMNNFNKQIYSLGPGLHGNCFHYRLTENLCLNFFVLYKFIRIKNICIILWF